MYSIQTAADTKCPVRLVCKMTCVF